jgi:hypothetical protein
LTPGASGYAEACSFRTCRWLLFGLGLLISSDATMAQTPAMQTPAMQTPVMQPPTGQRRMEFSLRPSLRSSFDIPSQPLSTALETFAAMTQIELFYQSELVTGRRSSSVRGELVADAAIAVLLKGTGLSAMSFDHGTITILPAANPANAVELSQIKARAMEFKPYLAAVQYSLNAAVCRMPAIQTDPAELLARLWIAPSGVVSRAELLSSTGTQERDHAYGVALATLAIAASPPAAMPQPITLMILPRQSRELAGCAGNDPDSPSAARE